VDHNAFPRWPVFEDCAFTDPEDGSCDFPARILISKKGLIGYLPCMQHVVAGGDVAPLVGHNAFLRWSAIKDCAFTDPEDGQLKFWSEAHVSEDFDMSVRMQIRNYIGRYVAYTGNGKAASKLCIPAPFMSCLCACSCCSYAYSDTGRSF